MTSIVVQMLEDTLAKARTEGFSSICISVTGPNENYYNWTTGQEVEQLELISSLHDKLRAHVENWRPYEDDPTLDVSYACYHCASVPNGFDFLTWLITQEIYRIEEGAPAPLKVAFWRGRNPQPNPWIDRVYRPLIGMIGGVEDDKALRRMGADVHVTRTIAAMCRIGAKLPKLRAVNAYDVPFGAVTITLRECDSFPHRNSDLLVWYEFAKYLEKQHGENVVFVRDTSKADEQLTGCKTAPLASRDLDARMCLYENAKMNFFVSNGPMMLAALTENIPYITFVQPEEMDSKYDANKPHFWKLKMGVEIGQQFPWAGHHQRIVWEKPTLSGIKNAYNQWRYGDNGFAIGPEDWIKLGAA
jgi:hypothetical protein